MAKLISLTNVSLDGFWPGWSTNAGSPSWARGIYLFSQIVAGSDRGSSGDE